MPTPLPTLPGVYYGYVYMTFQGRRVGSTFTFKASSPPPDQPTDEQWAQFVADALVLSWNTNMMPRYDGGVTGTTARVYPLGHPLAPASVSITAATGSAFGDQAAVAAAAVIRHTVHRRGRGSQGHTAISPLQRTEVTTDGQSVTAAFITNMNSDFGDFIGGVQAAWNTDVPSIGLAYVQLSRVGAGATYPILSSATETLLGTERSRTARP